MANNRYVPFDPAVIERARQNDLNKLFTAMNTLTNYYNIKG